MRLASTTQRRQPPLYIDVASSAQAPTPAPSTAKGPRDRGHRRLIYREDRRRHQALQAPGHRPRPLRAAARQPGPERPARRGARSPSEHRVGGAAGLGRRSPNHQTDTPTPNEERHDPDNRFPVSPSPAGSPGPRAAHTHRPVARSVGYASPSRHGPRRARRDRLHQRPAPRQRRRSPARVLTKGWLVASTGACSSANGRPRTTASATTTTSSATSSVLAAPRGENGNEPATVGAGEAP